MGLTIRDGGKIASTGGTVDRVSELERHDAAEEFLLE